MAFKARWCSASVVLQCRPYRSRVRGRFRCPPRCLEVGHRSQGRESVLTAGEASSRSERWHELPKTVEDDPMDSENLVGW